jgi:multiple sugar transport system permease protein
VDKKTVATRWNIRRDIVCFLLALFCAFMIIPVLWMIATSLRSPLDSFSLPPHIIPTTFDITNYRTVFQKVDMFAFLKNSVIYSVSATALQLMTSSMAAFAFARLQFWGKNFIFFAFLAALMIPGQVLSIPRFIIISRIGWINSLLALIVPSMFSALAIFLIRQFMATIPKSYDEAAYIDGATRLQCYRRIVLPMTKPVLMVMAMQTFVGTWNDFYGPLIYINAVSKMTLPLGLVQLNGVMGTGNQAAIIAGVVLTFIPPLFMYIFGQRYLIEGISIGGIK